MLGLGGGGNMKLVWGKAAGNRLLLGFTGGVGFIWMRGGGVELDQALSLSLIALASEGSTLLLD